MSISSESGPLYNEFYDKNEVSDVESEGFIDRTVKKTTPPKRRAIKPESSFLGGLLAPFEGCCFSKGPSGLPVHAGSARLTGPLSEFVLQTSELPDDNESPSDGSSSGDEIALGATAKTFRQNHRGGKREDRKEDLSTLRKTLEAENVKWVNIVSSEELDDSAKWKSSLSLTQSVALGLLQLTDDQKRLAALYWCASVTLSQKMTPRLLEKIITVARWEMPEEMSIEVALKKREEFGTLEFMQIIQTRLIEEIMGEFQQQASAEDPSATFLVISKVRTVATVSRRQGDALLITVFDCGMSRERGPAFLGFDRVETAERYLIDLYTADPLVTKSTAKFSAWRIGNKQQSVGMKPEYAKAKGIALSGEDVKPVWDTEEAADRDTNDPQHHAKLAYTAMYKATDTPMNKEHVFTHSAAGALHVKDRSG